MSSANVQDSPRALEKDELREHRIGAGTFTIHLTSDTVHVRLATHGVGADTDHGFITAHAAGLIERPEALRAIARDLEAAALSLEAREG